jgi:hypothetical protein
MNEQQLAAVKQALEALRLYQRTLAPTATQIKGEEAITDLQSIISQDALHKMAEESRTSGLRLDDWDKIGCVNHDCDKCKAVQEPVAKKTGIGLVTSNGWDSLPVGTLFYTAPQPVPVKTYHDGKPWPVAPKPWVGLTDDEIRQCETTNSRSYIVHARAIEARLKEKNHDQ